MAESLNSDNFVIGDALIEENELRVLLSGFEPGFIPGLRESLIEEFQNLQEKFHLEQRYIGWWLVGDRNKGDADRVYIFFEKNAMSIRIRLSRQRERDIKAFGYEIQPSRNFQGQAGWITGWKIPYDIPSPKMVHHFFHDALVHE